MYPNRLGTAKFDRLEILCYEIFTEEGQFSHHEYWIEKLTFGYESLLEWLKDKHPSVFRLMFVVGESAFLGSVLSWEPGEDTNRDAFYLYLASQVTDWQDQPVR